MSDNQRSVPEPTERCRHDFGWLSTKDICLFINDQRGAVESVMVGFEPRNKVVMKCNNSDCRAHRNAYFSPQTGAFLKFSKVRIAKAEGQEPK